jgi:hypothetical protein
VLISDEFYPALTRPNVALETATRSPQARARISPSRPTTGTRAREAVTSNPVASTLDVLVLATGFDVTASLARVPVVGRDGLILARAWGEREHQHVEGMVGPVRHRHAVRGHGADRAGLERHVRPAPTSSTRP